LPLAGCEKRIALLGGQLVSTRLNLIRGRAKSALNVARKKCAKAEGQAH
jgi:hypothetical protein